MPAPWVILVAAFMELADTTVCNNDVQFLQTHVSTERDLKKGAEREKLRERERERERGFINRSEGPAISEILYD